MWEKHIQNTEVEFIFGRRDFEAAKPSLLCLHGAGGEAESFFPQLSGLNKIVNTAALSFPGHGKTPGPGRQSIEEYTDWLAGILAAGPIRPVLLGHSMGGAVAMTLALRHPQLLRGLVLVATGAKLGVMPFILEGIMEDFDGTVRQIVNNAYAKDIDPRMLEVGVQRMSQTPPQVLLGDFKACNGFDIRSGLNGIRQPCLVIGGENDVLTPLKYSEYLAGQLPDSRLEVIEGAGHMVHLENPVRINRLIQEFMSDR